MELSKTERRVLHLLAWGKSNPEILETMNLERRMKPEKGKRAGREMSLSTLHTVCTQIRKKTGIKNTKDATECRNWERAHPRLSQLQKERGPTTKQMEILWRIAAGERYPQICEEMHLTKQAAMNLASEARKRAKLTDNLSSTAKALLDTMFEHSEGPQIWIPPTFPQGATPTDAPALDDPAFN